MRSAVIALAAASAVFVCAMHSPTVSAASLDTIINSNKPVAKTAAKTTTVAKAASSVKAPVDLSKTVIVNPGDYLTEIATDNNTSVQRLYDANTFIANPDLIYAGQQLTVPDEKTSIAHRDMPAASAVGQQVQAEAAGDTSTTAVASDAPAVADGSVWDEIAACESGGNWAINTGNGFYGGLQFTLSSWQGVGGAGYPNQASREEQILRGQMLQARSGWGAWSACSARLGL